jgi:hypothetical protein
MLALMRETNIQLYFAVLTVLVAVGFVAYAVTGADLCIWCIGK